MNWGVLLYFQSFLSAFLFILALVVWFFASKKSFYDTFRCKLAFTFAMIFGLTFLIKSFLFLHANMLLVQYGFQLLLLLVLLIVCISCYFKLKKPETGVTYEGITTKPIPKEEPLKKLDQVKQDLNIRAKELDKKGKELLKREKLLAKLDAKLRKREVAIGETEREIDEDLKKIKDVKREIAKKQVIIEDSLYNVEREKAEADKVSKLKKEVDKEMDTLDERGASFEQELVAYRAKLQDLEDDKEILGDERERLNRLKMKLEEDEALLKEKKKRLLDAYEQLDKERDVFGREKKSFEKRKAVEVEPVPEPAPVSVDVVKQNNTKPTRRGKR